MEFVLVSILVTLRQTILCSHHRVLPTNRDPNKILCCCRTFLSHLHPRSSICWGQLHIYLLHISKYKTTRATPKTAAFQSSIKAHQLQKTSLHHILKAITHSRRLISKASSPSFWYR
jgi:hypothetical protein